MTSSSNSTSPSDASSQGWLAELELTVGQSHGKSRVVARRHEGPLVVQRAFHPERDGTCHLLLLHPPGGLVSSDRLVFRAHVLEGARALVTTPAATKLYRARSEGAPAAQTTEFRVASGALVESLPQEVIVFDGARAVLSTDVALERGASFLGWEIVCLGRPAAGERFTRGSLVQRVRVRRAGRPVYHERLAVEGGSPLLDAPYGLRGQPVTGTFVCVPHELDEARAERIVDAVRAALDTLPVRGLASVTARGEVIVVRTLGPSGEEARNVFACAWSVLRPLLFDKPGVAPRIWKT